MISVVTNYLAMNAGRQFNIVSKDTKKSTEKLSSGYKINRAADDAAGLSISEKMRHQIRNLNQACDNIQDGISLVHTADGVFEELTSITKRINELCVQSANDTNSFEDRAAIDAEIHELKEEISDALFNASFNSKKLFNVPYVPEVLGQPETEQIQVFNDELGGYGGISINNVRYTWDELGVSFDADGNYKEDFLYPTWGFRDTIKDPSTGETINLMFRKGERPPMAIREYHWEAKDDGIYVNKILACEWENLEGGFNKANPVAGRYSFCYRGMTFRFSTEEGDDFKTIMDGLNGQLFESFQNEMHWNVEAIYSYKEQSVDIKNPTSSVIIHDFENAGGIYKKDYMDVSDFYELRATAAGVQLVDKANHGHDHQSSTTQHTLMPWSSFVDVSGNVPKDDTTNNGYPIIDWGKTNEPNDKAHITLDDKAVYKYTDEYTGISFEFTLKDEISLEQIEKGMTLDIGIIKTSLTAPTKTSSTIQSSQNKSCYKISANVDMTYEFMLNADRVFDDPKYNFPTTNSFIKTGNTYTYTYSFPNNLNMKGSVSEAIIKQNMLDLEFSGTSLSIKLNNSDFGGGTTGSIKYEVNGFSSVYNKRNLLSAQSTSAYARSNMTNFLNSMSTGKAYNDILDLTHTVNNAIADITNRIDRDNAETDPAKKLSTDERNNLNTQLNNYQRLGNKLTDITNTYKQMNNADAINDMHQANQIYDKIIVKNGRYTDTDKSLTRPDYQYSLFDSNRDNAFSKFESDINTISDLLNDCYSLSGNNEYGITNKIINLKSNYTKVISYANNISSYESEQMNYCRKLKDYRQSYIDTLNSSKLNTQCTDYAVSHISNLNERRSPSIHTVFDATFEGILPRKKCMIQSGANSGEATMLEWECLNLTRIGLGGACAITREQAVVSIVRAEKALKTINRMRSLFGAYENRLVSQYDNNRNYSENLDEAESKLRDTDMAEEITNYTKHQILQNAGQAMLSQANQQKNMVLDLLK